MIKKCISVTSHALYPLPLSQTVTFSDPLPLERDVLYGRPLRSDGPWEWRTLGVAGRHPAEQSSSHIEESASANSDGLDVGALQKNGFTIQVNEPANVVKLFSAIYILYM